MRATTRVMTTSQGSCPNCGQSVPRLRGRAGRYAAEAFACPDCGRFEYSTRGPVLPLVVPVR